MLLHCSAVSTCQHSSLGGRAAVPCSRSLACFSSQPPVTEHQRANGGRGPTQQRQLTFPPSDLPPVSTNVVHYQQWHLNARKWLPTVAAQYQVVTESGTLMPASGYQQWHLNACVWLPAVAAPRPPWPAVRAGSGPAGQSLPPLNWWSRRPGTASPRRRSHWPLAGRWGRGDGE